MRVVFLDIDGVLNSEDFYVRRHNLIKNGLCKENSHIDPRSVEYLNEITDATDAVIVLSSSWRFDRGIESLLAIAGVKARIIGKTPYANSRHRGTEINKWLVENGNSVENYVILDDDDDFLDCQRPHLVQTNAGGKGLDKDARDKCVEILENISISLTK